MRGWTHLVPPWRRVWGQADGVAWASASVHGVDALLRLDLAHGKQLAFRPLVGHPVERAGLVGPGIAVGRYADGVAVLDPSLEVLWRTDGRLLAASPTCVAVDVGRGIEIRAADTGEVRGSIALPVDRRDDARAVAAFAGDVLSVLSIGLHRFTPDGERLSSDEVGEDAFLVGSAAGPLLVTNEFTAEGPVSRVVGPGVSIALDAVIEAVEANARGVMVVTDHADEGLRLRVLASSGEVRAECPVPSVPRLVGDATSLVAAWPGGVAWLVDRLQVLGVPDVLGRSADPFVWDGFPIVSTGDALVPVGPGAIPYWDTGAGTGDSVRLAPLHVDGAPSLPLTVVETVYARVGRRVPSVLRELAWPEMAEALRGVGVTVAMTGRGPDGARDPHLLQLFTTDDGWAVCAWMHPEAPRPPVVRWRAGATEWSWADVEGWCRDLRWRIGQPAALDPIPVSGWTSVEERLEAIFGGPAPAAVLRELELLRAWREGSREARWALRALYAEQGWGWQLEGLDRMP